MMVMVSELYFVFDRYQSSYNYKNKLVVKVGEYIKQNLREMGYGLFYFCRKYFKLNVIILASL